MQLLEKKRNRFIKEKVLENLQDGFIFPVIFSIYHRKDEMRVTISFFEIGTAFLDMTTERYDMLPTAKWDKKEQTYIIEDEEKISLSK